MNGATIVLTIAVALLAVSTAIIAYWTWRDDTIDTSPLDEETERLIREQFE